MSGPNAAHALPPGDRDDAPLPQCGAPDEPPVAVARREPQLDLFPEIAGEIRQISAAIDEAQLALGDLKIALNKNDVPSIKAAAWRLSEALMVDLRGQSWAVRRKIIGRRAPARHREAEDA